MIRTEGQCITIARVRAGMTAADLARRLFYSTTLIKFWEYGKRTPPWEQLYSILPELPKIREAGCAEYCPKADICLKTGKCTIATSAKSMLKNRNVVEVVRCKNCKHFERGECYHKRHAHHLQSIQQNEDDFCSYGERSDRNG